MAYTKQQLLEAYCRRLNYKEEVHATDGNGDVIYDANGIATTEPNPESRTNFLKRTERARSKEMAIAQLRMEALDGVQDTVIADTEGVDL